MQTREHSKLFHKDFSLVVIGQIISLFGNGMIRFALPLYLLKESGSSTLYGLVMALSFIPMIVLMPIGGIIADRVNKRNIMVALDFFTALLMLVLLLLLGKVDLVILLVIVLMLLFGIQGTYQPAVQASIPLLQDESHLLQGNAVINQVSALAGLISPMLGGVVFGLYGIRPIIIIGGVCFFISAVMELFIVIPHTPRDGGQGIFGIVKQDTKDSFHFMRREKPIILKGIVVICGINLFLSALIIIAMPVLITQTLALSDALYGVAQGTLGLGGIVGGILVGVFAKRLRIKSVSTLLFLGAVFLLPAAVVLFLPLSAMLRYIVIVASFFILMCLATMATIQLLTYIQMETPTALTGKVIACVMALSMCAQPVGQAMYGFLFDALSSMQYLVVFGGAIVSMGIALLSRSVFHHMSMERTTEENNSL